MLVCISWTLLDDDTHHHNRTYCGKKKLIKQCNIEAIMNDGVVICEYNFQSCCTQHWVEGSAQPGMFAMASFVTLMKPLLQVVSHLSTVGIGAVAKTALHPGGAALGHMHGTMNRKVFS